jgi:hypothetical protein
MTTVNAHMPTTVETAATARHSRRGDGSDNRGTRHWDRPKAVGAFRLTTGSDRPKAAKVNSRKETPPDASGHATSGRFNMQCDRPINIPATRLWPVSGANLIGRRSWRRAQRPEVSPAVGGTGQVNSANSVSEFTPLRTSGCQNWRQ